MSPCRTIVGEGDVVVAYVHIEYLKPNNKNVVKEIWQYWSVEDGWKRRDKHLGESLK